MLTNSLLIFKHLENLKSRTSRSERIQSEKVSQYPFRLNSKFKRHVIGRP